MCAGEENMLRLSDEDIRKMRSDMGKVVKEATPSTPVEIIGLSDVPSAGDKFMAFESEKKARVKRFRGIYKVSSFIVSWE